jgi:hypothetical protein
MSQKMGLEAERYAENLLSLRDYCEIEGCKNSEGSPTVMIYIFEAVACSWFS